ncbi:MAG: terminase TerL endonuclease subunit [Dehalococcoidia bacterium]|jgi:phage terminase large subunit-like protein
MKDYVEIARKYRDDARKDRKGRKFCKWVRLAAEREYRDQQRAKGGSWEFYFDSWWANDVCSFFEKLPHVEGQWETKTITLEPSQIFILCCVFGWRRRIGEKPDRSDPRRFTIVYEECARKQAKSTTKAGVALYCLTCEGENGPQVKTAATTGQQARLIFGIAHQMVERTQALREWFRLEPMANSIVCWRNGGHIQPINSKASTQDGLNPHLSIIDELHAHKDRKLFDVLMSARGARKNPLSWYVTTAGYNQAGVCYEQRTILTKILEGIFEADHFWGIIYTLDEKDSPYDPKVWIKANPMLGVSVQEKELRDAARQAQISPQSEGEFKTKRCNLWLNAAQAWLNMAQWDACADSSLKIEQFYGRNAYLANDLSSRLDTTSSVILTTTDDGFPVWFGRFYLPEDSVQMLSGKHAHYIAWAKQGLFTLTPGNYIDYDRVERDNEEWAGLFNIQNGIAFDNWGSQQIASRLEDKGLTTIIMPYTSKEITPSALDLEGMIQTGRCRHDGNPVMKWMASNTVVDRRVDGSILPKKESKDSANKIDGIAALLMAWSRMRVSAPGLIYDTQGVFAV